MGSPRAAFLILLFSTVVALFLLSCSSDEDDLRPPPGSSSTIAVQFENARTIEVDSRRHRALLLHTGEGSPGTAIQLVDLSARSLVSHRILTDYLEVFDVKFVGDTLACFAGRPHGHVGYAVQFVGLPSLYLSSRVMVTSDTSGRSGYLAVDSAGANVYYSHNAGANQFDGIYRISVPARALVDADNDGAPPYGLDHDLVSGLFADPQRLFVDHDEGKLVVDNFGSHTVTIIDFSLWGTWNRSEDLVFPIPGTRQLPVAVSAYPRATAYGAGIYVQAGWQQNASNLTRFTSNSLALDLSHTLPDVQWRPTAMPPALVHSRADVVSVFVLQEDTSGVGIGQYRLNNLLPVSESPYRTRAIPDSSVTTIGLDTLSDHLVVADRHRARLELIRIK